MIDYIPPPVYSISALRVEQVSSDDSFNSIYIYNTCEDVILDLFESMGGVVTDRATIIKFFKENQFVADGFIGTAKELSQCFDNSTNLILELSHFDEEKPELFLVVKTKSTPEDALVSLREFDKWFIPNIY